ncbi:hypothetical protein [Microbacterium sp. AR7-10]|nr:hypothetical protein [Microbacterium sp. AR7-10]
MTSERVCAPDINRGRAYCGRKTTRTAAWQDVTCTDCHAAAADKEAR